MKSTPLKPTEKLKPDLIEEIMALTPLQEGMLFHYLKNPESDYYFEQLTLGISGEMNREMFEQAWNHVIETNEMLRTVFRWEGVENPVQVVLNRHKLQPRYYDTAEIKPGQANAFLEEITSKDREEKFDLRDVPFRVTLCKIETGKYRLIISNHHILYDGWSNGILLKEFFNAYHGLAEGRGLVKEVKTKFKDFVIWIKGQDSEQQDKFWRNYLNGFAAPTELTEIKRIRTDKDMGEAALFPVRLETDLRSKLDLFIKERKITSASFLYGVWGLLLQGYTHCRDVVFGTSVSGRTAKIKGIEEMVGLFINTVPLRVQADAEETAGDLLVKLNHLMKEREAYEACSLVDIKKNSNIGSKDDFFDNMVIIENYPLDARLKENKGKLVVTAQSMVERAHYDLTVTVRLFAELELLFTYNREVFAESTITRLSHHFITILETVLQDPGIRVSDIDILSATEKKEILYEFNNTGTDYPEDKTIQQLFTEQAGQTPDRVAVIGRSHGARRNDNDNDNSVETKISGATAGETTGIHLTYSQLNKKAGLLALQLRSKGVGQDTIVAIMLERSIEMIIGIMGILTSGGAYLPIEQDYPRERIGYMLADSRANVLITFSTLTKEVKNIGSLEDKKDLEIIYMDSLDFSILSSSHLLNFSTFSSSGLAYIIYTSGTTGKPKGVLTSHFNAVRVVKNSNYIRLTPADRLLQLSNYAFDGSVFDIYGALLNGGVLVMMDVKDVMTVDLVSSLLIKEAITVFFLTTAFFNTLVDLALESLSNVRNILFGGERVSVDHCRRALAHLGKDRILHVYGPTETTVYASYYPLQRIENHADTIPIGKPLANTLAYILDRNQQPVPIGLNGEIYIGGKGTARGYLNRPSLTMEKFIPNPFVKGDRLYRTGDIGRWLAGGNIEFIGRVDHQVKIRGFRVELGEIESRLLQHEKIKEAIVMAREDGQGDRYCCAYIVSVGGIDIPVSELKQYLMEYLPAFMVPAHFIPMKEFPLASTGKVDRKQLPDPAGTRPNLDTAYAAPGTDLEKTIAAAWKDVLQIESVGIYDNFFDVGGNSLKIIRLSSRLTKVLGKSIPVTTLFRYPTIDTLVRYLQEEEGEKDKSGSDVRGKALKRSSDSGDRTNGEIAVIGMAGRFPGAPHIDQFWENLINGVEAISFFSPLELQEEGIDAAVINDPAYVKAKGVLEGQEYFDPVFFDYTSWEAGRMDPQLRVLHEVAVEALDNAGYSSDSYSGMIGVYLGSASNFQWLTRFLAQTHSASELFEIRNLNDSSSLATRISYKLDLRGPAVTVQTACSTSLAAIDMACNGLLRGRCDIALAGGVSIYLPWKSGYLYQDGMIKSPDGHCRAFAADARGTVGGDGAGVVVLKRLNDALADRDMVRAVIKGSALNNDGKRKVGFTAPSIEGQAEVIKIAHQNAGVQPDSITYVEAHGTGTPLGDPVEIEGLKLAFNTEKKQYCALSAVKTNIGHLDEAAGAAGFIKAVLALEHRLIPPVLNVDALNPKIDFVNSPFFVNTRILPWESHALPLRAGVSSFGIGGTNAHVVLEEAPKISKQPSEDKNDSRKCRLIPLSAKTRTALDNMTGNLLDYFRNSPGSPIDTGLADVAYTLQVGRKAFPYRRMLVCSNRAEAVSSIMSPDSGNVHTFHTRKKDPRVVFMFPGQGAQYVNMGLELYESEPLFRQEMDRSLAILKSLLGYDLKEVLYPRNSLETEAEEVRSNTGSSRISNREQDPPGPSSRGSLTQRIDQTEIAQPVLFAIEYALARLLMAWGIRPWAMIGHSLGEYTAACLAGVFSLEEVLPLVALRGQLMQKMPGGDMLSVALPREKLEPILTAEVSEISLAAVNSPSLCVVSGPEHSIRILEQRLVREGCDTRRIHTSHAFHSAMMDPILKEFEREVALVPLNKPCIPYVSNLTGNWISLEDAVNPAYWASHLRQAVRFSDGLEVMMNGSGTGSDEKDLIFVEVGPGKTLGANVRKTFSNTPRVVNLIKSRQEQVSDTRCLLEGVGRLWLYGYSPDWTAFNQDRERHRIPLPAYPFDAVHYPTSSPVRIAFPLPPQSTQAIATSPGLTGANGSETVQAHVNLDDWFYIPTWKQSPLQVKIRVTSGRDNSGDSGNSDDGIKWLVLMKETDLQMGWLQFLQEKCNNRGNPNSYSLVTVQPGERFSKLSEYAYSIDPDNENHYDLLFKDLHKSGKSPGNIIHMWCLEDGGQTWKSGLYSLIYVARALGKNRVTADIRLAVVTANMQDVTGDEKLNPAAATLLGPAKIIPQEYPNIRCRSIDIRYPVPGDQDKIELIQRLYDEFAADFSDLQVVAYRGKHRWVQGYDPLNLSLPQGIPSRLKPAGVYLVTGGLGGMGFTFARYLARRVQARLILTGRSPFPSREQWDHWLALHGEQDETSRKILEIRRMEKQGAQILVHSCDVSDSQRMEEVIALSEKQLGPVSGVLHTAGIIDYGGIIQRRTRESMEQLLAAKVTGTLVLDRLLQHRQLDFFILFSSLGNILYKFKYGEVGYNAANEFLDAFASYKQREKGFTTSINWNDWLETGMSVQAGKKMKEDGSKAGDRSRGSRDKDTFRDRFRDRNTITEENQGIISIKPEQGVAVLERILDCNFPRLAVCNVNLLLLEKQMKAMNIAGSDGARHPLLERHTLLKPGVQVFLTRLNPGKFWVLREHMTPDNLGLLPGTVYLEMVRAACRNHENPVIEIRDVQFISPLVVGQGEEKEVALVLNREQDTFAFSFFSRGSRQPHVRGNISLAPQEIPVSHDINEIETRCRSQEISGAGSGNEAIPENIPPLTLIFGPRWTTMKRHFVYGKNQALARLELAEPYVEDLQFYKLHPALLDVAVSFLKSHINNKVAYIPFTCKRLCIKRDLPARLFSYGRLIKHSTGGKEIIKLNITIMDEQGTECVDIEEFTLLQADFSGIGTPGGESGGLDMNTHETRLKDLFDMIDNNAGEPVTGALTGEAIVGVNSAAGTQWMQELVSGAVPEKQPARSHLLPRPEMTVPYTQPANQWERIITDVVAEFLGLEQVGVNDNFFELGATSLNLVHMNTRLKEILEKDIPVVLMFEYPTVRTLSRCLQEEPAGEPDGSASAPVLQSSNITQKERITRGKDKLKRMRKK